MQESDPLGPLDTPGPLGPAKQEVADALQALLPAAARTCARDVWFRAGLEAGRRRANSWRAVAAAMAVAAGLSLAWGARPAPAPVERIVYVRPEVPAPVLPAAAAPAEWETPPVAPPTSSYPRLCQAILRDGLGALPPAQTSDDGGKPDPRHDLSASAFDELPHVLWYR